MLPAVALGRCRREGAKGGAKLALFSLARTCNLQQQEDQFYICHSDSAKSFSLNPYKEQQYSISRADFGFSFVLTGMSCSANPPRLGLRPPAHRQAPTTLLCPALDARHEERGCLEVAVGSEQREHGRLTMSAAFSPLQQRFPVSSVEQPYTPIKMSSAEATEPKVEETKPVEAPQVRA